MDKNEKRRLYRKRKKAEQLGIPISEVKDGRGKHNNHVKGSSHPRWNPTVINQSGYKMIRVGKNHPFADPNGYVFEHILVVVSAYGLDCLNEKVVHHKNLDKQDNRLENLEILSVSEHVKIHNSLKPRDENTGRFKKRSGHLIDGVEYR